MDLRAFEEISFTARSTVRPFMFFPREDRNLRQNLVFSVFPAPDSPLITIDWLRRLSNSCQRQKAAKLKTCGGRVLYSKLS